MKSTWTKALVAALLMALLTASVAQAAPPSPQGTVYIVRWGDTLYSIARRFGTTVTAIMQANGLTSAYIYAGQRLIIPPPSAGFYYTVRRGDTLYSIARRFGTTVTAIAQANGILNPAYIRVGQALFIPTWPAWPPPPPTGFYYTVRWGDTLYSIARRYGTTVWAIAQANGIANPSLIRAGQRLFIPGAAPPPAPTPPAPPPPAPTPPAPTPTPTPAPPPPTPLGFGYGIQVHMIDQDHERIINLVKDLGFNWVKHQVVWKDFERTKGEIDWSKLDSVVDSCHAAGLNILLSVVKAPDWARPATTDLSVDGPPAHPEDMANFMAAMAERYKGKVQAYEIWNEQNLHYEWGNEPLDASRYVQLLAACYQAIKAKDPNAIVVSGALTPCGDVPGKAIDDLKYLEQMYQAGLKKWCDAVGVHPSGYNVPPDADWRTWSDPTARFRGPSDNRHHSWSFRGTMEGSREIMVRYGDGAKRLWPTEFGWASVEGLGVEPAPGYEYAADNTEAEQAQFIVKAYQMGKSWGWVGPMFLWNLNFGPLLGAEDEKAAFSILYPDWRPRQAYAALHDMPK